jgi:pilus assembly protein CpaC
MHRTNPPRQALLRALFAALAACLLMPAAVPAQEAKPAALTGTLTVAIGGTHRLQMTKKQVIARAINQNETVLRVGPVYGDPTSVLLTGLEPGVARVTLIDEANKQEVFEVIVQLDVELLRNLLKRAVPTANIDVIPGANNTVVLRGSVGRAEDVEVVLNIARSVVLGQDRVINALKVDGVQQVQLCVVVAKVDRQLEREFGFSFISQSNHHFLSSTVAGPGNLTSTLLASAAGSTGQLTGAPNVIFGVINGNNSFLGVLTALRNESLVKILAEPRLTTISGKAASFLSGGEQAIPVPAGLGQVGVQFEEFGTRLNVLPIVLGDGRIHLEVEPEVSNLDPAFGTTIQGTIVPGRATQRVHTTVDVEPGQTLVIGGLIQNDVAGSTSKVPVLGELPIIGAAFSIKSYTEREQELVILVTPHLVDGMSPDQLPKFLPGLETRSPDDYELFLEGILEAPRGPRNVWQDKRFVAAYKNGPTASQFPCGGNGSGNGGCGNGGCANGNCATGSGNAALPPLTSGAASSPPPAPSTADSPATTPAAEGATQPAMAPATTPVTLPVAPPPADEPGQLPPIKQ